MQDDNNQDANSKLQINDNTQIPNTNSGMRVVDPAADLDLLTKNPVPEASLADEVEEFEEKQKDFQAMYNAGGKFKEQLEQISGKLGGGETVRTKEHTIEEVEEILTNPEVEKSLERDGYMEKIEHDAELAGGVTDDYTTRVLLGSSNDPNAPVTLPLTEEQLQVALHMKVWQSIRWLAEWCVRQIKVLHGRARYKA
jgi:hypothetical protein